MIKDVSRVLSDADAPPSVVWDALKTWYGDAIGVWEPDTFRIELSRRLDQVTDALMAKVLAAQTVVTTTAWTYDHDVLFAFALACDGVPAASSALHHPTPEQLAWSVREIIRLTRRIISEDEGFDPDGIDPAVAAILHEDGWVVAPEELYFCQDVLDKFTRGHDSLRKDTIELWESMKALNAEDLRKRVEALSDDSPCTIQVQRLADCRLYVLDREVTRAKLATY